MLLENKYSRWYHSIIDAAKQRQTSGYVERHHIIPRSLGGLNTSENLVALTSREHFVCHALLIRMIEGSAKHKMVNALMKMKVVSPDHAERYANSRLFESARKLFSSALRDPVLDAARRAKISKAHKALPKKTLTEEWKRRIGEAGKGRLHTAEYKVFMSNQKSSYWAKKRESGELYPVRVCPNCSTAGKGPNMSRYHFDNCKRTA